jgi:hypothetical protein
MDVGHQPTVEVRPLHTAGEPHYFDNEYRHYCLMKYYHS